MQLVVGIVAKLWTGRPKKRGSIPREGQEIFLLSKGPRRAVGPTQPPDQWVLWALPLAVKWHHREAEYSSPCNLDVKYT